MAIYKIKRFSSASDTENDESQKKKSQQDPKEGLNKDLIKTGIITGATIYGVKKGRKDLNHYLSRKSNDIKFKYDKKENGELFKKLKRIAKKQKTAVISSNIGEYSSCINKNERKEILDELKKAKKFRKEVKEGKKEISDYINKFGKTISKDNIIKNLKKHNKKSDKATKEYINELKNRLNSVDSIHTPKSAATLAHELGHSKCYRGRSKGFGEKIHVLSGITDDLKNAAIISSGFANGLDSYANKVEGKKESKISKYAPIISSVAMNTPTLLSEAYASYDGYKRLKNLGASDKFLKNYKKDLGYSLGTYATRIATDTGKGYVARQVGKLLGRGIHALDKRNKNKIKEENKDNEKDI